MAAKVVTFVCLQLALFNAINGQCLNRVLPGRGQNLVPLQLPVTETILPNQVVLGPNYGPPIMEVLPQSYGVETIVSNPVTMPATTIIQDSTVANNLANALQLLVVSNLLSNTLPLSGDVIVPSLPAYGSPVDYGVISPVGPVVSPVSSCGFGPYNYIY